jgi:hypothetical protein
MLEELASSSSSLDKDNSENPDTKEFWVKKCMELIAAKNAADVCCHSFSYFWFKFQPKTF